MPRSTSALAVGLGDAADLEDRRLAHRAAARCIAVDDARQRDRHAQVQQRGGDQRRVVEVRRRRRSARRGTPPAARGSTTSATSFCSEMKSLSSGGTTRRTAWGRTTWRIAWRAGEPERERGRALAGVHRVDAGAVDLGDVGARRTAPARCRRARPGRSAARDSSSAGHAEADQVDDEDRRHAAEDVGEDGARAAAAGTAPGAATCGTSATTRPSDEHRRPRRCTNSLHVEPEAPQDVRERRR